MINVLMVNEFRLMCSVIASVLEDEADINIVGLATDIETALHLAPKSEVILISTRLPDNGAIKLTRAINEAQLPSKVLVLGLAESEVEIMQYIEAGASGYVLQDDSVEELLRNIRAAAQGEALVSPEIASALITRVAELAQLFANTEEKAHLAAELTPREREILHLIAQDLSNQDIADRLFIEIGTVKNHVHNILDKLNVNSRYEAAAYVNLLQTQSPL